MKRSTGPSNEPLFSIIVPLYNKEKYLAACLKSIQDQTEQSWECIIVDDGSTDGSAKIVERFATQDSRFRLLVQKNAGPSVARNHGIRESEGKLLHFMDADDYYPAITTLEAIGCIYKKRHPTAIAGNIFIYNSDNGSTRTDLEVNSDTTRYQTFTELQNDYYFTRFFFDRKFIRDNKITFPDYTYVGEDPVFLIKALSAMERFLITDIPVYIYNSVTDSGSDLAGYSQDRLISYMKTQLEILEICRKNKYSVLQERLLERIDRETMDLYMQHKGTNKEIAEGLARILSFVDAETYHERVLKARERDVHVRSLEATITELREQIDALKHPGLKVATRTLMGAVKRKAKNISKAVVRKV